MYEQSTNGNHHKTLAQATREQDAAFGLIKGLVE